MIFPFAEAERMCMSHHCTKCGHRARLVARTKPGVDGLDVVCGGCNSDEFLTRNKSLTQQWRENPESVPVHTANVLEAKYGVKPMAEQALVLASETQMAERIKQARWLTELRPEHHQALAHLSVRYGLDPLMKELTMYEGSPYITVAGLVRIAHRQKTFAGIEDRPMTQAERAQYGYKAAFCWIVKVYRSDWKVPAIGTGTGDPNNPLRNNPVEKVRPEWMARSRAMRQALKVAYPHSLPFEEMESAEEAGIDPESGAYIDHETGEIHEPSNGRAHMTVDGPDDEPDLPFDDSDLPEPTAEEAGDAQSDLFAEARRAELLEGLHQKVDTKRDGWKRLTNYFELQYGCPPEQGTAAQLEAAYQYVTGGK